jgi:hypothetical protein
MQNKFRQFINRFSIIVTILFVGALMFQSAPLNLMQKFAVGVMGFEYTILAGKKKLDSDDEA